VARFVDVCAVLVVGRVARGTFGGANLGASLKNCGVKFAPSWFLICWEDRFACFIGKFCQGAAFSPSLLF